MKAQFNILLFIAFLFIVWLFFQTNLNYQIEVLKINFNNKQLSSIEQIEKNKISLTELIEQNKTASSLYEMSSFKSSDITVPIVYRKDSGTVWRYFINDKASNNELNYGFTPVMYDFYGVPGFNEKDAVNNYYIKQQNNESKKEQLKENIENQKAKLN